MFFGQTAAPIGWTKDTTNFNNSALRVVTGSVVNGGSVDFTVAFASQTPAGTISTSGLSVGATTLSTDQIPSHSHSGGGSNGPRITANSEDLPPALNSASTGNTGGGGSHIHALSGSATFTGTAINLAVKYVDVIRATKD
jgi:hypothetical protein